MTMHRSRLSWLNVGLVAGLLALAAGACTKVEDDEGSSGNGGGGNTTNTTGTGTGTGTSVTGNGGATGTGTGTATAKGGTTATTTAGKGGTTGTTTSTTVTGTGGAVVACQGVPASEAAAVSGTAEACNGATVEAEPLPVDMIILMDRSISNGYAVGSDTATAAGAGQTTRWQVLTSAMQGLAGNPDAANIGASITFFSINGGSADNPNCDANLYATPIVPLGLLSETGAPIVAAMAALKPAGLTPIVPALTGAFKYAMAEKQKDPTREKVVVMISDGFPTQCTLKNPSDVVNVIQEAATAPVPVRTFIIGIGSPTKMTSAKFNLQNYARAGNTGKPPFVLDEAAGAEAVQNQLITTLLNISNSPLSCEYPISPPSADWVVDPEQVMFTYKPNVGDLQEIPKVPSYTTCGKSPNGGWYFDDPITPTKITLCPCSCANFGAGTATVVYGCKPNITIE